MRMMFTIAATLNAVGLTIVFASDRTLEPRNLLCVSAAAIVWALLAIAHRPDPDPSRKVQPWRG